MDAKVIVGLILLASAYMLYKPKKEGFITEAEGSYHLPAIAWTHWNNDRPPKVIKDILENRSKAMPNWEVRFVTDETVLDYIDQSDFPLNYKGLSPAHRADWIRLRLLELHGGAWLDAGIIVNDGSALDTLREETIAKRAEYTGFYPNDGLNKMGTPSYIDNWFIMAPKGSPFITTWKKEYESAIDMGFVPYKRKLTSTDLVFTDYNIKDPNDVYLTPQACLQKILQTMSYKPNIILHHARDSMMKLHAECASRPDNKQQVECIHDAILNDPKTKDIPYIKLRKEDRGFDIGPYFNDS
jgi:hypothetical protein